MYTHVHSVAGTAIVGATYLVTKDTVLSLSIGGALAFISHHYIDKLGEASLTKSDKYGAEIVVMANLLSAAHVLGDLFWIPLAGIFFGNLMDLIDKKFGLVFFKLDIVDFLYKKGWLRLADFARHNLNASYIFKCHRLKNYKYLSYDQTMSFAFVSIILSIIFHFLIILNN